jgi:hypothetical protein
VRENRLVQSEKVTSAREVQRLIGKKSKAQYDLAEPIPDRFVELLKQLAQLELLKELTQLMDEPDSKGLNPKSFRAGLSGLGQCAEL